jgi:hypothetical protein
VTDIELTTGHVCSPSEGTSLDCSMKPTEAADPAGSVNFAGAVEKTDPCPVVPIVVESGAGWAPCIAPISVTLGRPSR